MTELPAQNTTLIELHVPDFEPIKAYYKQLGFTVAWERKPEEFKGYLVVSMNQNIICFWGGNEQVYEHPYFNQYSRNSKRGYGVELVIMVDDIEQYYERVKDFVNAVEPLKTQPWGLKDFRAVDPAGYYLRFTSNHDIVNAKYSVK